MNYKNLLILSFLMTLTFISNAQDRVAVTLDTQKLYLNILAPGVEGEFKVSENQSISIEGELSFALVASSNENLLSTLNPSLISSFRNYYQRKKVKKELNNNSGNYIGILTGYTFGPIAGNVSNTGDVFFTGGVWGIQRNYKSGIHLGLSLGLGITTGNNRDLKGTTVGEFNFGLVLK